MALNVEHDEAFYNKLAIWQAAEIKDKNKGESFMGDFTVYSGLELDFYGGEMCLLFLL